MPLISVLRALWLFLPAYVANMSPVFTAKLIPAWKAPIDGGRLAKDGRRVLGPGKTWRGLVGGTVTAGLATLLLSHTAAGPFSQDDFGLRSTPAASSDMGIVLFGALVGFMALVGDAVKSYFKRRRNIERGRSWFPFDQLDFVVFGLLGVALGAPLLAPGWVRDAFLADWVVLATLLVLTPLLHLLVNRIGYWLGLKEVPW
jgi:CDP-2,3-bis-(O-geranylgeranyl)-sn-glycerol synthase